MKKVFLFLLLTILFHSGRAQSLCSFFSTLELDTANIRGDLIFNKPSPLSASFVVYQRFISSQDGNSCPFELSCSRYMVYSIRHLGSVEGFLNGLDRLHRCNGFSNHHYPRNSRGRLIDPLEW